MTGIVSLGYLRIEATDLDYVTLPEPLLRPSVRTQLESRLKTDACLRIARRKLRACPQLLVSP